MTPPAERNAADRAARFVELHRTGCFALPNAWDAGSAWLLASLGPVALATTSAGAAWTLGRRDGAIDRAAALANARAISAECDLPRYAANPPGAAVQWPMRGRAG
jgi:2-methylisocitrate lyase-like PEP mutase family enzyme